MCYSILTTVLLDTTAQHTVKTINGKPISEDQVDAWVAEAKKGYDIEFLRSRGSDPRDSKRSTTPEG